MSPAQITTYVGGLYERHEHTAGGVAHKMHVMGPEGVLAVVTLAVDAAGEEKRSEHYLHPGHDGSAGVITSELGAVVERRSYDPFGQRRNPDGAADALTVVGVGVLVKLAGKVAGGASKARSAARAGVEALEESVGAARGGGSILREASEATFRAADDVASWVPKIKHILGAGSQSKAQFAMTNFDEVRGIVQEALRSPNAEFLPNPNVPGTFRVVTNLGRSLGVQGQEAVRVIVGLDGKVINAFPVHVR